MQKEALVYLQESANIQNIIDAVKSVQSNAPFVAVPHGFDITNLEKYMDNVQRYRNKFGTKSIENFIKYNEKFAFEGSTCFVDSTAMSAFTVFDMGTTEAPLHKEHTSYIQLDKTAAFNALLRYDGEKLSQKSLAEFVEEWADNITVIGSSGDCMKPAVAASIIRKVTIDKARSITSEVGDYSANMTASEMIEAKADGELPAYIEFKCEPYFGLQERPFKVRLGIDTGGDVPAFFFRVQQMELIEELMADEFKGLIEEGLKETSVDTFIGTC